MNKFVYFMAVGLVFTILQVTTVEASHDRAHVGEMRAMEDQARQTMRETEDQTRQTMRETEDQTRQTARETEDQTRQTARDAEDRALEEAEEARNSAEGMDHHPEGVDHHPMMDPRTDPPMPFSPADEAIYQPYADECKASGGTISEASMAILITPPHNFTRGQVEGLCQESAHDDGGSAGECPPGEVMESTGCRPN